MNIFNKAFSLLTKKSMTETVHQIHAGFSSIEIVNSNEEIMQNPVVYRCIKLIAQNIGSIPILIDGNCNDDRIKCLLDQPNLNEDMNHLLEKVVSHLMVDGNAYLMNLDNDEGLAMYSIDPKHITAILNEFGIVEGYSYRTTKGIKQEMIKPNGKCRILNVKYLNPFGVNISPCKMVGKSVHLYNSITKHNQSLMENAARFSGALIINGHMSNEQKQKLREEVDSRVGCHNAGHLAILQGDMRWEEMKANVRDADYTQGQTFVAREIMQVFGVPPTMLGITDTAFQHYKEARLHFWEDTLRPLALYIIGVIEKWLNHYSDESIKLKLDFTNIPAFSDKTDKRLTAISGVSFLSDQQKRDLCGL